MQLDINNKNTTINDVKYLKFDEFKEENGILVPITNSVNIPFDIKRIFYVYGVKSNDLRGEHAHKKTEQVIICPRGTLVCMVDDGYDRKSYVIDDPKKGLYVPAMIWDEQIYISKNTIMLSLTNSVYNKSDYISNYQEFKRLKQEGI